MAPNIISTSLEMHAKEDFQKEKSSVTTTDDENGMQNQNETRIKSEGLFKFKTELKWWNVVSIILLHMSMLYFCYTFKWFEDVRTTIWMIIMGVIQGLGVTAGAHRFWTHRAYKAKWPLRIILLICYTSAGQDNLYQWVRDHRVHHKFTDTDADPYNARRGFFYSHIGWLMVRKHPDVIRKGATVDMSDLDRDPLVVFQKKWYSYLALFLSIVVPTIVPWWGWGENLWYAWHWTVTKYCINLNITWSVNSAAHMWGVKPFDKSITPTDNAGVSFLTLGEGWHNYHHVFPWDYKAGEFGNYWFNFTATFIDLCAYLGLAYDLKTASANMVKKRVLRSSEMSY
ncbi:(11Z)-hexadec-11-enoyl-CoA conjugase-like isoform X2 [Formica exsecta]|uniref:(11Z)-hexadec-11-enoyl-CoA conjugase-like isoform X2 n=1 Tax=Formica exsecta TaxID=72781 RepID=UPI001142BCAF|nr:(11Z)-hexadec-11-enoyl-CoA conjugase-like isoform X2 [Formica exsecta]